MMNIWEMFKNLFKKTEVISATNETPEIPDSKQAMLLQLSCPVCLDLFTDPILFPCLHSTCKVCANYLMAQSTADNSLCPECKQPIGSAPLKKNFPLNNMVEIFKQEAAATRKNQADKQRPSENDTLFQYISVDKCTCCVEPEVSPPSVCCLECNMGFCETCLFNFHPTVETTPEHTILLIENFKKGREVAQKIQEDLRNVSGTLTRVHAEMMMNFKHKQ